MPPTKPKDDIGAAPFLEYSAKDQKIRDLEARLKACEEKAYRSVLVIADLNKIAERHKLHGEPANLDEVFDLVHKAWRIYARAWPEDVPYPEELRRKNDG